MKKLEKQIYSYLKERNWHKLSPADIAKSISIESAELLELFQWSSPSLDEVLKDKEKIEEIKKELADVLIYAFEMATLLKLDTEKIIVAKLKRIQEKYPAKLMKEQQQKPGDNLYWKIKKEHRLKGIN